MCAAPRYNNLHERLLFNWIGKDIEHDYENAKISEEAYSQKYLQHLKDSLSDGLWLTEDESELLKGYKPEYPVPMVCFTELALKECIAHATRYGKMGLAFTKRFVLDNGGQPVAYIRDRRKSPFVSNLKLLLNGKLKKSERERLELMACYIKNMEKSSRTTGAHAKKLTQKSVKKAAKKTARKRIVDPYKRQTGRTLHHLEEAEWRMVAQQGSLPKKTRLVQNTEGSGPSYFLPYKSGIELVAIIFPNNKIFSRAMKDPQIVSSLFPGERPPVNLISLEDVNRL